MKRFWTKKEDGELRLLWKTMSAKEIGLLLGRSQAAVANRARRLQLDSGLRCGTNDRAWTVDEDRAYVRMYEAGMSPREMAARLNRTVTAIHCHRDEIGLPPIKPRVTDEEIAVIRRCAQAGMTDAETAIELGTRNKKVINLVRKRLGIDNGHRQLETAGKTRLCET